jgi:SET domain
MCGVQKIPTSQWLPVAAVFLKLHLVVRFNHRIISAYKANYNSVSLPRLTLGSGMFLASSLVNHGCDATMYEVLYGTTAVFRARRPISKGEQLTNCYAMPATNERGTERRKTLYAMHKFTCR